MPVRTSSFFRRGPVIETIEGRLLFAATLFEAHVNFQPAGVATPTGYLADVGTVYGAQNGLTYGWYQTNNAAQTRVRTSSLSPDARYATLTHLQKSGGAHQWDIAVPNGNYEVHIASGDSDFVDGNFQLNVEGSLVVSGKPSSANHWVEGIKTISVNDGKLTVTNASGASNNKINFIDIKQIEASPSTVITSKVTWTTKKSAPTVRAEALKAVVDGKLYTMGGFSGTSGPVSRIDVYDPATDTWASNVAQLPRRLSHSGVATVDHNIYVVGGYYGSDPVKQYVQIFGTKEAWVFNTDTKKWTNLPQLPKSVAGGGAAVIDGKLHYFGGDDINRKNIADHYVLDLANLSAGWKSAAPLGLARSHFGTVVMGGKIYAIAGQTGNDETTVTQSIVEAYDPATDKWTKLASTPRSLSHIASSAFVVDNHIIIAGGESANGAALSEVKIYDPVTNSWSALTSLPSARFSGVADYINGKIVFTGGSGLTTTWWGLFV